MKKILALFITLSCIVFSGCGNLGESNNSKENITKKTISIIDKTTIKKETTTTITQSMISDEDSQLTELNDEIIEEYTNEDGSKVSVIKYDDNNVMICIEFSTDDIVTNIHLFTDLMNDNKYENDYDVSIYGLKDGSQIVRYSEKIGLMWFDDEYEKAFDNPSDYID